MEVNVVDFNLTAVEGKNKALKVLLNQDEITIGRNEDNCVVLEDERVSRHHCVIRRLAGNRFEINDLASTNGTYINGEAVNIHELTIGDKIRTGDTVFLFEAAEDTEKLFMPENSSEGTKIITITEMKIAPEDSKILDGYFSWR